MLLEQVAHFNRLSPKLRKELESLVDSFGKTVRYRFNISHKNPDPTKYNGEIIWPSCYNLDPAVFNILDPYENRDGETKLKTIALIEKTDEKGLPNKFTKIKVYERTKGELLLNLESPEHRYYAMYLELHLKNGKGKFKDKNRQSIFERVDELSAAKEERQKRSARKLAMDTAEKMSDKKVIEFANAMLWEQAEPIVLRNKLEEMAENNPEMFNDIVSDKKIEYRANIKRGIDNNILEYNPVGAKLLWAATKQTIVSLGMSTSPEEDIKGFAEWFMTNGQKGDETYKKLISLLGEPELA